MTEMAGSLCIRCDVATGSHGTLRFDNGSSVELWLCDACCRAWGL